MPTPVPLAVPTPVPLAVPTPVPFAVPTPLPGVAAGVAVGGSDVNGVGSGGSGFVMMLATN